MHRAALIPQLISGRELVRHCVEPMRQALEGRGLKLVLSVPMDVPPVRADVNRIRQVFANLLANAIKYTRPGGVVTVSLSRDNGEARFSVSDTGMGIPARYLPRIFGKFFRVPGQPGDSGTGLGLTIVKDIVEAHGGRVGVESREGFGTTFHFSLPLAADVAQEVQYANS
jgi:signal transduction histidine kinase